MSAIRLGRIFYDFGANTAEFEKSMKRARSGIYALEKRMRPVIRQAKRVGIALTAAAGSIAYLGKTTADAIDRQAKLAQSLRTSIGSIAALERAADLSGLAVKQLEAGLRVFTVQLSRLADGSAPIELAEIWEKLGLSAEKVAELPLDKRIAEIQRAIEKFIPKAEQAAARAQLFGTRTFLAFGRIDSATLDRATNDIERFGAALSDVAGDAVEEMNDSLGSLSTGLTAIRSQIVAGAAPAVDILADRMAEALEIGSRFRERLAWVATTIGYAIPRLVAYAQAVVVATVAVKGLSLALAVWVQGLVALRAALIRTGILAAFVVIGEVIYRLQGAAGATDEYREAMEKLDEAITGANAASRGRTHALESEARAALSAAEANLALRRSTDSPALRAALAEQSRARAAFLEAGANPHGGGGPQVGGSGGARAAFIRMTAADAAVRRLRETEAEGIAELRKEIAGLYQQIAGFEEIDLSGKTHAEFTAKELAAQRKALQRRIEEAEGFRMSAVEQRLAQARRARDDILEGLKDQGDGAEDLARRTRAAYAEIERSIRGNLTWMERLADSADTIAGAFETMMTRTILNFREMGDAVKAFGMTIAETLVRTQITAPFAQGLSNAISGFSARMTGTNPWLGSGNSRIGGSLQLNPGYTLGTGRIGGAGTRTMTWNASGGLPGRADGGPVRGFAVVGERGPEIADFGRGASIYSNERLRQLAGRGAGVGVGIDISVNAGRDWDALQAAVEDRLAGAAPEIVAAAYNAMTANAGRPSDLRSAINGGRA